MIDPSSYVLKGKDNIEKGVDFIKGSFVRIIFHIWLNNELVLGLFEAHCDQFDFKICWADSDDVRAWMKTEANDGCGADRIFRVLIPCDNRPTILVNVVVAEG